MNTEATHAICRRVAILALIHERRNLLPAISDLRCSQFDGDSVTFHATGQFGSADVTLDVGHVCRGGSEALRIAAIAAIAQSQE